MIVSAASRYETTLHISEYMVGFEIPDKPTVNLSFHGFTDATYQRNSTIIGRIFGSLPGFGTGMIITFLQSIQKLPDIQILLKIFKVIKSRVSVHVI